MARRRQQKKPPEGTFTATIDSLSPDGRGVARLEGKATFIANALPGEIVEFNYQHCHSKFDEGTAINILTASDERTVPKCRHFGVCGGCRLQHLLPASQIAHKQKMLLEHLTHFGHITPKEILAPLRASEWGYRHKARLGVRYVIKKEMVLVGFREQQSNYLALLEQCEVLEPRVGLLILPLRALITKLHAFKEISQIEVAIAENAVALIFRNLVPLDNHDQELLKSFGAEHTLWIYLQSGGPSTVSKLYPDDNQLFLHYSLPEFNLNYQFHPLDFTQVNPAINRQMIPLALSLLNLKPEDRVLDLFLWFR